MTNNNPVGKFKKIKYHCFTIYNILRDRSTVDSFSMGAHNPLKLDEKKTEIFVTFIWHH